MPAVIDLLDDAGLFRGAKRPPSRRGAVPGNGMSYVARSCGDSQGSREGCVSRDTLRGAEVGTLEYVSCLLCGSVEAVPVARSRVQVMDSDESFTFVRCAACGLVYLNPRVPADALPRYYGPDYLPHRAASAWGRWAPLVRRSQERMDLSRLRLIRRERALGPANAVLDVGCGRPTFLRALHRATGARAVGVDAAAAWRQSPGEWSGVELVQCDLNESAIDGTFDVITCWHVVEHLYDPVKTLRTLRERARPGATLVVEVPDYGSLTRKLQGAYWGGYHTPRHTAAYTAPRLRALLQRSGWCVQRQLRYGTLDPYVLWWLGCAARRADPLTGDLGRRFPRFLAGKLVTWPFVALQRWLPLGLQTAVARAG
jgi:SAM-dependent methyltransferase